MAALAATGALIVGGGAAAMVGSGNAEPLDVLAVPNVGTTTVLPDLAPFTRTETTGTSEVSDHFGAPLGGGEASLRLTTPGGTDKAAIATSPGTDTSLAAWIPAAAYSAFQGAAVNPIQYPSMQLTIDYDPTSAAGFSTLTYEPANNPDDDTTPGVWHRYQAGAGNWCSTRAIPGVIEESQRSCSNGGAKPLAAYVAGSPDLVVTGLVINQGSGNPGLDAAVDLVSTPSTTYDFELTAPQVPCEEPTPGHGGQQNGGHENEGHEDGGQQDGGHENGGHENEGHENGGHENEGHDNGGQQDSGHENGGHEDGGQQNGGHEDSGQQDGGHEDGGQQDGGHEQPQPCT
jgi:hypothetical protein